MNAKKGKHPVRAAIIGVSGYGKTHYDALISETEKGTMQPVAATIINRGEEAEKCATLGKLGAEIFTNYRKMFSDLSGKIDLCLIPTGIPLHAATAMAAMRAGACVYMEKPAAATIDEVQAMQQCERETGKFVAVGYQAMYSDETYELKKRLRKMIGTPRVLKYLILATRLDSYYTRNGWAGRLRLGDQWVLDAPFNNSHAHQLNLLCFLAGKQQRISTEVKSVEAELYRAHDIESADTACIRVRTAEDAEIYHFSTHCNEGVRYWKFSLEGDKGAIISDPEVAVFRSADGVEKKLEPSPIPVRASYDVIMRKVLERMKNPDAFICDLSTAGVQTLCANAAYESSPVLQVPNEFIKREPSGDSVRTSIAGVDQAIREGFEQRKLFSELDTPWARKGTVVPLENYTSFQGRHCS